MKTIHSGSSKPRVVRSALLPVLVIGFAALFLWDGYRGYPADNARELLRTAGAAQERLPPINPKVTAQRAAELIDVIRRNPATHAELLQRELGEPSLAQGTERFYLGAGGWLKVRGDPPRPVQAEWINGPKSETDQQWQRWIGFALVALGMISIVRLVQVLRMRVSLTDEGLSIRGAPPVPFDSIRAVEPLDFARTGKVLIRYSRDGRDGRIEMDDYAVKDLHEIVASICERCGIANPIASAPQPPATTN